MPEERSQAIVVPTYSGPLNVDIAFKRSRMGQTGVLATDYLPRFREGGVGGMTLAVSSVDDIRMCLAEIEETEGQVALVQTGDEMDQVLDQGRFPIVLCANYEAVGTDLELIPFLRHLGVQVLSLSGNRRNYLADGCAERNASGLSHLGVAAVRELDKRGILPDVSHLSESAFWDVVEHTDQPIVATHSNARALCDSRRNLSDSQVEAIAESGGLIGVSTYPTLVAEKDASLDDLLEHIDYLVRKAGIEHVAIGTDFVGFMGSLFDATISQSDPGNTLYNEIGTSVGTEQIASFAEVKNLITGLVARDYEDSDLERIQWKNLARVLDRS